MSNVSTLHTRPNIDHWEERVDLAASFRWTERLNLHEAVANHFSLAVNEDGTQFLMNPNQMHFSRIKASNLLLLPENCGRPQRDGGLSLISESGISKIEIMGNAHQTTQKGM